MNIIEQKLSSDLILLCVRLIRQRLKKRITSAELKHGLYLGVTSLVSGMDINHSNGEPVRESIYSESNAMKMHMLEMLFQNKGLTRRLRKDPIFASQVFNSLSGNMWVRGKHVSDMQLDMFFDSYSATDNRIDWFMCLITEDDPGHHVNGSTGNKGSVSEDVEEILNRIGWYYVSDTDLLLYKEPEGYEPRAARANKQRTKEKRTAKGRSTGGDRKRRKGKGTDQGGNLMDLM